MTRKSLGTTESEENNRSFIDNLPAMRLLSLSIILPRKEYLAKINNLLNHHGAGPNTAASVFKNAGTTRANTASRRLKHILCSYSMMRFIDIMIMAFLGGIESSHGHVLPKMRCKTTLIAIIGLVKPCLTGIVC